MKNNRIQKHLIILAIAVIAGSIGYVYGRQSIAKDGLTSTGSGSSSNNETTQRALDFYRELSNKEKGVLLGNSKEVFDGTKKHFSSPYFEGKPMDVYRYQFKGDTIIESRLELGNGVLLYFAEYIPKNGSNFEDLVQGFPANFVTFSGYENYSLYPTYVGPRVMLWDDSTQYEPTLEYDQQQQIYYQEAEYAPKRIGVASLSTYVRYFQGVKEDQYLTLISISKTILPPVNSVDDPSFRQAIEDLKPIIDTIQYGEI